MNETTNDQTPPTNTVRLRGRVSTAPEERELPSGAVILTLRVSVRREPTPMTQGSKQQTDWVDCSVWAARTRRAVARWREGDTVEVEGALRRRFYRGGDGTATRLEVEVLSGRLVSRAATRREVAGVTG
jgi:single-strand DNA-binding protein